VVKEIVNALTINVKQVLVQGVRMKRGVVLSFVFLVVILMISGSFFVSSNLLEKNKAINSRNKITNLTEKFNTNPEVSFFVHVKEDYNKKNKGYQINKEEIKNKFYINKIENDFGDYIVVRLNQTDYLSFIKDNPDIEIFPVGIKKISLQDSTKLVTANTTWRTQISGINLTGSGQTICIIDTGVNYSHPDLGGCFGNNNPASSCKVIGGIDFCPNNIDCSVGGSDNDPMDVDGHGTHVSGIAAANGNMTGVASESKLVMIKVSNSSGSMWDDDIISAINWCVNNASIFNISVISMSLGGSAYIDYCDSESNEQQFVVPINSAVAKNISVVVASGNDGYFNAVESPACIQNSTPVTASPKTDNSISSFANTWNVSSKFILAAPGEDINSTIISGGYSGNTWDGTSMATPHVAGAVAIINQYLKLKGQTRTPQQITSILNSTGKQIYDSSANRNFSRIDIYAAIASLDSIPSITFVSPGENSGSLVNRNNILVNVTSDSLNIKNMTIRLYNSTLAMINSTNSTTSSLFFNFTNLTSGIYYFNASVHTTLGNLNHSETRNITLDTLSPTFSQNLTSGNTQRYNNIILNITLTDNYALGYARLESNHTGGLLNYTYALSGTNQALSQSFNITTFLRSFSYRWNFNDSAGNNNETSWHYVSIANTPPINLGLTNQSWLMNSNLTLNLSQYFSDIDGDEINYTNTSVANISILINQTTKIATLIPNTNFNGTKYIQFIANDSFNVTLGNNITLEVFKPAITFNSSSYSNLTTNFSNLTNFINISVIFDNLNYGRINFSAVTLNNNSINFDNYVNISSNKIEINSSILSFFNTSAVLTLLNLSWNNTMIQKDGVNCTSCNILNYTNGSLIFNVTGFSVYTTRESPRCGDGSCESIYSETCSSCSSDCGACSSSPSGGGGGGGGGSINTPQVYYVLSSQLYSGYNQILKKEDKIKFELEKENYSLILSAVDNSSLTLILNSSTQTAIFFSGETKKFSLENLSYYDLSVQVNSIIGGKANITIKRIYESVSFVKDKININNSNQNGEINEREVKQNNVSSVILEIIMFIVFVFVVISYVIFRKSSKDKKKKKR
jgi:subtilisin family serine protease